MANVSIGELERNQLLNPRLIGQPSAISPYSTRSLGTYIGAKNEETPTSNVFAPEYSQEAIDSQISQLAEILAPYKDRALAQAKSQLAGMGTLSGTPLMTKYGDVTSDYLRKLSEYGMNLQREGIGQTAQERLLGERRSYEEPYRQGELLNAEKEKQANEIEKQKQAELQDFADYLGIPVNLISLLDPIYMQNALTQYKNGTTTTQASPMEYDYAWGDNKTDQGEWGGGWERTNETRKVANSGLMDFGRHTQYKYRRPKRNEF